MTALYLTDQIVERFRTAFANVSDCRSKWRRFRNDPITKVDWYIMPLLNPDGYEFSHDHDRLWRKNRRPPPQDSAGDCFGVDLNRNWDVVGNGVGASDDPCSDTYRGVEPNSEPEVRTAAEKLLELKDIVRASLSLHSYGQLWLTSWGYKAQLPVDNNKMIDLGEKAAEAIEKVNGRKYKVGAAGKIFYPAGGASDDFAKGKAHIPYAVTVELPGGKRMGFHLPEAQIIGVGEEMFAALEVVASRANRENLGEDEFAARERERNERSDTF